MASTIVEEDNMIFPPFRDETIKFFEHLNKKAAYCSFIIVPIQELVE